MLLQAAADAGQVVAHGDAGGLERPAVADPRPQQQLGRAVRAAAQHRLGGIDLDGSGGERAWMRVEPRASGTMRSTSVRSRIRRPGSSRTGSR